MCFSSHISGFSSPETNRHSSFIASSTIQIIFIQGRICQFRYLLYRSNWDFNIFTVTAMMNRSPSDEYDILFNTLFIFT